MKIFNASQVKKADAVSIQKQNITSTELMERAATKAFQWIQNKFTNTETTFHVFCGQGNNGGDGLVIARLLKKEGYNVSITIVEGAGKPTNDFKINLDRLKSVGIESTLNYAEAEKKQVIIDAIFGIGLTRPLDNEVEKVITYINSTKAVKIAIDVPSGLFLDRKTEIAVQSDYVLTFQVPKLALYLPGNYPYVKAIKVLYIGLDEAFITDTDTNYYLTDSRAASQLYKPLSPYAHKGTQGHAMIIGGSYGKMGAACLSAKAALKAGCGLVTAYIPQCGYTIMQTYLPEAMVLTDSDDHIKEIAFDLEPSSIGIGMGLGQEQETQRAIYDFFLMKPTKTVIDADAINILSKNKEWLELLPQQSILTPHPKELQRLIGKWGDDFDMLEKLKVFSKQNNVVVVAKNARTIVVDGYTVHVNSSGNAALATGGSGDVLTGILTGLLAQGYNNTEAAILGVYLHGLTADIAIQEISAHTFTATSIIDYLSQAYKQVDKV